MRVTGDVTSDERKNRTSQLQEETLSQWSCSLNTLNMLAVPSYQADALCIPMAVVYNKKLFAVLKQQEKMK